MRRPLATATAAVLGSALLAACAPSSAAPDPDAEKSSADAPVVSAGGVPVPRGDLRGWHQIFTDEFDRAELGDRWGTYEGTPGGNPHSWWDPSMVTLSDGALRLGAERVDGRWITGGVSNYPVTQRYGRWEIRMRADRSEAISYHMLLWPQDENWPPEIDFAESVSPDRTETTAFLHWVDENGENDKDDAEITGRFDEWHTIGVEWLPGLVRYLLDGEVWAEARGDDIVPDVPMWLGLQAEAGACERRLDWGLTPCSGSPDPAAPVVEIDWVTVYAPIESELREMESEGLFEPAPDAAPIG
ncbi:glycoside hydrolase [Rhodococcus rhodnii]|uniref:Glycoside hydrolase n=1 Tax=Rhodococcus rhodnii TaxID=38312 RepID=A0A6P2CGE4_9NOCA|nr:glycoside hydrolase family 16 protein [Rhodococcus rhodnii]TXG91844.1 glycoside hydrolase [Rhodococcus rhodnii]